MEINYEKLFEYRNKFVEKLLGIKLTEAQKKASNKIIKSAIEADSSFISVEFSRQSGKTTIVCATIVFLTLHWRKIMEKLNRPKKFSVVITAPIQEQAKTDFDRIKEYYRIISKYYPIQFTEANGNTIRFEENEIYCFSASPTSNPESKTANLLVIEEAQNVDDTKIKNSYLPMLANTSGPAVFIGTAGYNRCMFNELVSKSELVFPYDKIIEQRRRLYEETKNPVYLNYEKHCQAMINQMGYDSNEFKTQYRLIWVLERGQLITEEQLFRLEGDYERGEYSGRLVAGIDWGKVLDSTVVTIMDENYHIIDWLELVGDNYDFQMEQIVNFLSNYNPERVYCDATGTQDGLVSFLKTKLNEAGQYPRVEGVKFTAQEKDNMFKLFNQVMLAKIDETGKNSSKPILKYPKTDCEERRKFFNQALNIVKEEKNNIIHWHHPDEPNAHDDYCFVAGTLILTNKGQVPIENIKIGDFVMTRKGYMPVIATGSRYENVINKFGLVGTPDHPIITKNGVKKLININELDIIYIWNEKQSCIEEKCIIDILNQNAGNLEFITGITENGKSRQKPSTDKYGKTIMDQFQKEWSSTTKMGTHSTMNLKTLSLLKEEDINQCTVLLQKEGKNQEKICLKRSYQKQENIGKNSAKRRKEENISKRDIKEPLQLQKNINTYAKFVKEHTNQQEKQRQDFVQENAQINIGHNIEKVYNLKVRGCSEYFANNILVHNCDSLACALYAVRDINKSFIVGLNYGKL